ncbi:rhombosortase [Candidatus Magnetomorum sp. HK-1]|nr:rhombosortase [Candidatus Magnetomorum sp. HK-1]
MLLDTIKQYMDRGAIKAPRWTLILSGVFIILYLLGENVFNALVLDKQLFLQGEYWRFLTGHFVHITFSHFFWDLLAFIILGSIIELNSKIDLFLSLILGCVFISIWFCALESKWPSYCGLSGTLNGLLVVAVVPLWKKTKDNMLILVLFATLAKIVFETITNKTVFVSSPVNPIHGAHIVGFIAG